MTKDEINKIIAMLRKVDAVLEEADANEAPKPSPKNVMRGLFENMDAIFASMHKDESPVSILDNPEVANFFEYVQDNFDDVLPVSDETTRKQLILRNILRGLVDDVVEIFDVNDMTEEEVADYYFGGGSVEYAKDVLDGKEVPEGCDDCDECHDCEDDRTLCCCDLDMPCGSLKCEECDFHEDSEDQGTETSIDDTEDLETMILDSISKYIGSNKDYTICNFLDNYDEDIVIVGGDAPHVGSPKVYAHKYRNHHDREYYIVTYPSGTTVCMPAEDFEAMYDVCNED